jgi:hypothetical protein
VNLFYEMKFIALLVLLSSNYISAVHGYLRAGKVALSSMEKRSLQFISTNDGLEEDPTKESDLEFDINLELAPDQDHFMWEFEGSISPDELESYVQNAVSISHP